MCCFMFVDIKYGYVCGYKISHLQRFYLEMKLLGQRVNVHVILLGFAKFSTGAVPFSAPTKLCMRLSASSWLCPQNVLLRIKIFYQSDRWEMESLCGFILHFSILSMAEDLKPLLLCGFPFILFAHFQTYFKTFSSQLVRVLYILGRLALCLGYKVQIFPPVYHLSFDFAYIFCHTQFLFLLFLM